MESKRKILIIGGGAAGLIAAIAAARNGGEVTILERMNRVGKKILATGNGRCNLTNTNTNIKRFHGNNPKFAFGALGQFDVQQTMDFFEFLGVKCKVEDEGKVYPYSDQASSVLDVMRYELEKLEVKEYCEVEVIKIKKVKDAFQVILSDGKTLKGDKVILATGGKASPKLGSNGSGYQLAEDLGHKINPVFPALIQLKLKANYLKQIKGVKFIGQAAISVGGNTLRVEGGEILWTDYGISGPPILQLSRSASEMLEKQKKPLVHVDMFPQLTSEELEEILQLRLAYQPERSLDFSFVGLINKKLIPVVLKEAGIQQISKPAREVGSKEIKKIVAQLKDWRAEITDTQAWDHAQVTAGGVDVGDIDPKTMESKLVSGLYIVGELLDIDGDCGGFNLQWAWSSGFIAGDHASVGM
ncbi:BaiN/RdsA family NAD(P)/FAD-dependent oxidoreductase [Alkaliphilus hydrothermalis]|uniref:Rossmann fold flavoprotein n=1 Tax=Alkaliphilus hydrothermalis TaxID=1482730 RepID=A0ABS2NN84_9FIRM|nr:NAD(P)/FAD-dependent oxidoreductase [Alkaliphilus hydrothermalis]MBM7614316.1 putative Rossmann fold flavoprotein [Alkaliphilus hydrothermalis]